MILVKYEDLVAKPEQTLRTIANFIGVRRDSSFGSNLDGNVFAMHSTSASPQSSVGRWRTDLSSEEIELCERRTQSYMETFGYALRTASAASAQH
jgi:hypothetical protein